ncbi:MAG TPA: hypothetical protein VN855_00505, partial [Candidatus Acidoferrum sp.]|nr:hypothetical protein [Candidatus Acidoferrum sp.]
MRALLEEPVYDKWQESLEEQYAIYKEENCTCKTNENCECLSFWQYEEKIMKELESYWDDLAASYEEEHV